MRNRDILPPAKQISAEFSGEVIKRGEGGGGGKEG